jgi:uncharacterized protein
MTHYTYSSSLPFLASTVFNWYKQPGAFERLTPPWQTVKILEKTGEGIDKGVRIKILVQEGLLKATVAFEHVDYQEGKQFTDKQVKGPFRSWQHTHLVEPRRDNQSEMIESIQYKNYLPFLVNQLVKQSLNRLFIYRHRLLQEDLIRHQGVQSMKVLISGSSGLIGSALIPFLTTGKHQVTKLVRPSTSTHSDEIQWNPELGILNPQQLEGFDAVIHLSGESIMGRWTAEKKQKIRESRLKGTQLLAHALSQLKRPPSVFICSSAVGYYGSRGEEVLMEQSTKGTGFLSDVCEEWEQATRAAVEAGIRTVNLRTGTVLSPKGGALKQLLTPFKLGLGGKVGSGQQYMSWIAIDDLIYMIHYLMQQPFIAGPVNAVSPLPVTNAEFTKILGAVLKRPTFLTIPSFAISLIFGEMGTELLLSSQRVEPVKLTDAGFQFSYANLESALRYVLGY